MGAGAKLVGLVVAGEDQAGREATGGLALGLDEEEVKALALVEFRNITVPLIT